MTIEQIRNATRVAQDLPYTGYDDLLVYPDGSWISPAIAHEDGAVLVWGWDDGEYGYRVPPPREG